MNISPIQGVNWLQRLEAQLVAAVRGGSAASADPVAAGSSDPASSAFTVQTAGTASTTTPPPTPTSPSTQYAPSLLSALVSAQAAPPSSTDVANSLIKPVDQNADGVMGQTEVDNALSRATGGLASNSTVNAAFAKLDTNSDGQLSASELSAALDQLMEKIGRRHHHPAQDAQASTAAVSTATPAPAAPAAAASGEVSGTPAAA